MINKSMHSSYMLTERHFTLTILVALLLHVSGFVAWNLSPKRPVRDIPIRTLNIRLGESEELASEAPPPVPANLPQVEAMVDKIMQAAVTPQPATAKPETQEVKQYVRETNSPLIKKSGSKTGARDAEMMSRYTQLISLWIQKFKIYPEEARTQGLHGETLVRIRIDRHGNIRYYALEHSTGSPVLDRAAVDMIRRANPVPAVPNNYPAGELFEFLIPVNFSLK